MRIYKSHGLKLGIWVMTFVTKKKERGYDVSSCLVSFIESELALGIIKLKNQWMVQCLRKLGWLEGQQKWKRNWLNKKLSVLNNHNF